MPTTRAQARRGPVSFPQMMKLPNEILCQIIRICFDYRGSGRGRLGRTWKQLSSASRQLRILSIPLLFQRVEIGDKWNDKTDKLHSKLLLLEKNQLILGTVRFFVFRASRCEGVYHYDTAPTLLRCLATMPNLQEISLRLQGPGQSSLAPMVASHLEYASPAAQPLESVISLSIHSVAIDSLLALVPLCPNLKNMFIEIPCCVRHSLPLLAASKVPRLNYIMLSRMVPRPREDALPRGWILEDIKDLASMIPNIHHLALVGMLENTKITELASEFCLFKQLEQLDITDEQVVSSEMVEDILYEAPFVFNYDDPEYGLDPTEQGIALNEAEGHWLNEDRKDVATKFFKEVPSLRRLCLSRCYKAALYEAVRNSEGRVTGVEKIDGISKAKPLPTKNRNDKWDFGYPRVLKANFLPFGTIM